MARRRRGSGLTKEQKTRLKQIATMGGLAWITWEGWSALVIRRQRRRDAFNAALSRKAETGKPLVVLGDPEGSFIGRIMGPDFDCADLCIAPRGCANCENVIVATAEQGLQDLSPASHVVFVDTGVLERAENPNVLLSEIQRVGGGDFFMAPYSPWTIFAWLPPAKRRVLKYPPRDEQISWKGWGGQAYESGLALAGTRGGNRRLRLVR